MRETNTKVIFTVAASLAIALVIIQFSLISAFQALKSDLDPGPLKELRVPPEPRLQVDEAKDLKVYLAGQKRLLESYAWLDQKRGTARIPIQKAMEILTHGH